MGKTQLDYRNRFAAQDVLTSRACYDPGYYTYENQRVMGIPGSRYVAVPNGRSRFDIIDVLEKEFVCQLLNDEVRGWLIGRAREEGVRPNG